MVFHENLASCSEFYLTTARLDGAKINPINHEACPQDEILIMCLIYTDIVV